MIKVADTMSDIKIRIADESDATRVSDFICLHFNDYEPIQVFHVRKAEEMDPPPRELLLECVESETMLMAFDGTQLVGVLIAGEISSDVSDKDLEFAETFGPKATEVFELLSYVGEKADLCNRLKVPRSLHIHIISVHSSRLREGIASKLFEFCIENGRSRNYPLISVDCTSFFTRKIAEKFGMICLSTVTYDEYNKHIGKQLFVPCKPHTEIRTYTMFVDANKKEITRTELKTA